MQTEIRRRWRKEGTVKAFFTIALTDDQTHQVAHQTRSNEKSMYTRVRRLLSHLRVFWVSSRRRITYLFQILWGSVLMCVMCNLGIIPKVRTLTAFLPKHIIYILSSKLDEVVYSVATCNSRIFGWPLRGLLWLYYHSLGRASDSLLLRRNPSTPEHEISRVLGVFRKTVPRYSARSSGLLLTRFTIYSELSWRERTQLQPRILPFRRTKGKFKVQFDLDIPGKV